LFEETDSINYDAIVDQLRKKCGPLIRANRDVLVELPAALIDTIKRACEGILIDFIDSYYIDSKFSGSGENGSSGEQMIACNKYMAVVIATKSDHPVKFNTLRLLGELSK
jgi:hypothetical protein